MRIKTVIERTVKVDSKVRNARVDLGQMTVSAVAVVTDVHGDGGSITGFAFNSFGRYGCGGPLRDRFIPRLLALEPADLLDPAGTNVDPGRILAALLTREKAAGHAERSMALGTLELALWDVVAKVERRPLYQVLADRFGGGAATLPGDIPTYAAGGFYGNADEVPAVGATVAGWRDAGFVDAKIKAGGGDLGLDCRRIEAARAAQPPGGRLALDLSCAFDAASGVQFAQAVKPYDPWFLEEPCDPLDFEGYHAVAQTGCRIAGGENLFAAREFDNFLRYGRLGPGVVLEPDPALAYGVTGLREIVAVAQAHGLSKAAIYPHGGNMMSLHIVAGLGLAGLEAYPGQFGIFGGFSREIDIRDGRASLPSAPGIGFEEQPALFALFDEMARSA
ncbi:MAG: mandelate racemase [Rhodoplanes sp.]|uniref:enolase C-terminal domain-like protein n=1 Tax=Rhodoplanes sp. TaxID=1968906 RepID=UPI00182073E1|nr:enolase C-terminal domain-like protein [Rhodoplanes sp.]NVO14796.1 mandelate racemase [Rhodoplanes sp.]